MRTGFADGTELSATTGPAEGLSEGRSIGLSVSAVKASGLFVGLPGSISAGTPKGASTGLSVGGSVSRMESAGL